jgi:hypothetical protein
MFPQMTIGLYHREMSDTSPDDKPDIAQSLASAPKESPKRLGPLAGWRKSSRWPTAAAVVLAVIAVGVAVAAWFDPLHSSGTFSAQQTTAAKKSVCTAGVVVHEAVVAGTHVKNPVPNDPAGRLAVAANARLALIEGGALLKDRLASEPAAPADLAKAVTSMANTLEELGVGYLGELNSSLDTLRHDLDTEIAQINTLCT